MKKLAKELSVQRCGILAIMYDQSNLTKVQRDAMELILGCNQDMCDQLGIVMATNEQVIEQAVLNQKEIDALESMFKKTDCRSF
jgi:hypothetical protein